MKSVRPLVTITILTVIGVFLFRQLNKGPSLEDDPNSQWSVPVGVPGLQTAQTNNTSSAPEAPPAVSADVSNAVPWSPPSTGVPSAETQGPSLSPFGSPTSSASNTSVLIPAMDGGNAAVDESQLPEVPAIPELPPLSSPAPTSANSAANSLPPNIPVAQYPDSVPPSPGTTPVTSVPRAISGQVPSLGTVTPGVAAASAASTSSNLDTTPLAATPGDAATSAYQLTKPVILGVLSRGELARAHLMLSQWYGHESLSAAERQEVEMLLSQLAGTVIYSNEHRLEPAYTVQPGDTLETIAAQYQVPWQLLAKINGIPQPDALQAGQQIKVLRGPFMAVIDVSAGEVALVLDGRYAGKFPLQAAPTANLADGEWVVENKLLMPGATNPQQAGPPSAYAAPAVDRVLVLRSSTPTATGKSLTLGSAPSQAGRSATDAPPALQVSAEDAEELNDILSVGSRVVIRR